LKKKQKQNIIIVLVGITIIILVVSYFYNAEQAKIRGYTFGNELQNIQDELKVLLLDFDSKIEIFKEGNITIEEFLSYSNNHYKKMEDLIARYDKLSPPNSFVTSVELFKLSAQSQLESDKQMTEWIKSGDEMAKIRANELIQESFEYEMSALEKFNAAKIGNNP
jgi:hypothetical protein